MADDKFTLAGQPQSQQLGDKPADPLAELQRILSADDPFKVFDAPAKLLETSQPKPSPALSVVDVPDVPDVDDMTAHLQSLAQDIEKSFQASGLQDKTAETPLLFDDAIAKNQGDLFTFDSNELFSNLRGGVGEAEHKAGPDVAETIRYFDQKQASASFEPFDAAHATQPVAQQNDFSATRPPISSPQPEFTRGERSFAPIISDEAIAPTPGFGGMKIMAAVLGVAILGAGGLMMLSTTGLKSNTSGDVPVIKADDKPLKSKPLDSGKDAAPQSSLFNKDTGGTALQDSKLMPREEKPISPNNLPPQPGTEVLKAPAQSNLSDPKDAAIPPNAAGQVFGNAKKVKPLVVGPDGKLMTIEEQQAVRAPAPSTQISQDIPNNINGIRVPTSRPEAQHIAAKTLETPATSPKKAAEKPLVKTQPAPKKTIASLIQENAPAPTGGNTPIALNEAPIKAKSASYEVQLSAQRSEAAAKLAYANLQKRQPILLGGRKATIVPVDLGEKGVFYRVRLGSFPSREDANGLCGKLKAGGSDCIVQPN